MLSPKRVKHRKQHRGRRRGLSRGQNRVQFGEYGIKALEQGWLTPYHVNQLFQGRGRELLLGPYVLLERLGEGGMGSVFKARHQKLDRVVALKVIRKDRLANHRRSNRADIDNLRPVGRPLASAPPPRDHRSMRPDLTPTRAGRVDWTTRSRPGWRRHPALPWL